MSRKLSSVSALTVAPAGSGKTYARCACYITSYLLRQRGRRLICNYPINFKGLIEYCERRGISNESVIRDCIIIIPERILELWQAADSGPWDYLSPKRVGRGAGWLGDDYPHLVDDEGSLALGAGWHLALDEAHRFVGALGEHSFMDYRLGKDNIMMWQRFVGEIRHRRGSIEFLTQADLKIHASVRAECGSVIRLQNSDALNDPLFSIPLSEWFALWYAFTGKVIAWVYESEYIRQGKRERLSVRRRWRLDSELFAVYDSFSAPLGESHVASDLPLERWECLRAFISVYAGNIASRLVMVVGGILLLCAVPALFGRFVESLGDMGSGSTDAVESVVDEGSFARDVAFVGSGDVVDDPLGVVGPLDVVEDDDFLSSGALVGVESDDVISSSSAFVVDYSTVVLTASGHSVMGPAGVFGSVGGVFGPVASAAESDVGVGERGVNRGRRSSRGASVKGGFVGVVPRFDLPPSSYSRARDLPSSGVPGSGKSCADAGWMFVTE